MILALPFILAGVFWPRFPGRVASHWNIHGQADGWMNKGPGILLLPFVSIGMWALLAGLPLLDPKIRASGERGRMTEALRMCRLAVTAFFCYMSLLGMAVAAGIPVDMNRMITNGMLILLMVMGKFMGNLPQNNLAGIRTPWTLRDPDIWRATHRAGGRILSYGCLALLLMQWLLGGMQLLFVSLGFLGGCSIWSMVYSYLLYRRKSVRLQ